MSLKENEKIIKDSEGIFWKCEKITPAPMPDEVAERSDVIYRFGSFWKKLKKLNLQNNE